MPSLSRHVKYVDTEFNSESRFSAGGGKHAHRRPRLLWCWHSLMFPLHRFRVPIDWQMLRRIVSCIFSGGNKFGPVPPEIRAEILWCAGLVVVDSFHRIPRNVVLPLCSLHGHDYFFRQTFLTMSVPRPFRSSLRDSESPLAFSSDTDRQVE